MRRGDSILELDVMRRRVVPLTFGSLFAGIGGFDLGLERAGLRCAWQVEINPFCRAVLAEHWPAVPRYGDVREVGAATLAPVDLICGGFPCVDISNAGKRVGIGGARSGLWSEYARIVRELRPRYVLVENVAALTIRGLERVLADLAACRYDAEWQVFRAADVGAPHKRERLFLVAHAERLAGGDDEQRDQGGPAVDRQELGEASARRLADAANPRRESGPARAGWETRDQPDREYAELDRGVADAHGRRRRRVGLAEPPGLAGACGDQPDRSRAHGEQLDAAHGVADAERPGSQGRRHAGPPRWGELAARAGDGGVFAYLAAPPPGRWPAGPGDEQHAWEPPRVIPTQSAMGRVPDGVPADLGATDAAAPRHRRKQLEAYGNAVVPALAEWIGRAVVAHAAGARAPQDGAAGV